MNARLGRLTFVSLFVPTDLQLLRRAADGDESAFRALVERHEQAVARVVTAMLGSGDDADDVGQETFVRLFRAKTDFRGDAQLRTYLTRIAMNLCCDVLERRKKQSGWVRLTGSDDDDDVQLSAPETADPIEDAERNETLRQAVESLDAKHKAVVVLRILEDRSTRDTAALLGVPEGTVMSRLTRALGKLKVTLGPEFL
jgi:RNA polymerase sigma-70 factor (ECF subfamily)